MRVRSRRSPSRPRRIPTSSGTLCRYRSPRATRRPMCIGTSWSGVAREFIGRVARLGQLKRYSKSSGNTSLIHFGGRAGRPDARRSRLSCRQWRVSIGTPLKTSNTGARGRSRSLTSCTSKRTRPSGCESSFSTPTGSQVGEDLSTSVLQPTGGRRWPNRTAGTVSPGGGPGRSSSRTGRAGPSRGPGGRRPRAGGQPAR